MAKTKSFDVVGYHSSPLQIVVDNVMATTGALAIKNVGKAVPDRLCSDYIALVAIELPPGVALNYTFNTALEKGG